jgi:cell wall-associated NlpC family hydrolase
MVRSVAACETFRTGVLLMRGIAGIAVAGLVGLPLALVSVFAAGSGGSAAASASEPPAPSSAALSSIPPTYLALYEAAGATCHGIPWTILAGVGEVASDHGRGIPAGHASAGPMQFDATKFATYGVDGNNDGVTDATQPADAVYSVANLLCDNGAKSGADIEGALSAYTDSSGFVQTVLQWANTYGGLSVGAEPGSDAVRTAIAFAEAQLGKPYALGADGPDAWDCSSLVQAAYATAGIVLPRTTYEWKHAGPLVWTTNGHDHLPIATLEPGDLLYSAGDDGTPLNPGHVAMYIGDGQEIEAPHTGDVVKIIPVPGDISIATRPGLT